MSARPEDNPRSADTVGSPRLRTQAARAPLASWHQFTSGSGFSASFKVVFRLTPWPWVFCRLWAFTLLRAYKASRVLVVDQVLGPWTFVIVCKVSGVSCRSLPVRNKGVFCERRLIQDQRFGNEQSNLENRQLQALPMALTGFEL